MPTLTFAPASTGGWLALAGESVLLVLTGRPERFELDETLAAVSGEGGFQRALDLLTRNGLSATPEFVLVEIEAAARARLVVRGDMTLRFEDATGEHELTGAQVSTWAELTVAALVRARLAAPGAEPVAAAGLLPLASGAAWVSSLELRATASATAKAPAPASLAATAVVAPARDVPAAEPAAAPTEHAGRPGGGRTIPAGHGDEPAEVTVTELPGAADGDDYDHLFGATMFRTVADAAVRGDDDDEEDAGANGEGGAESAGARDGHAAPGDHDGHTVLGSDIRALRAARTAGRAETPPAASPPPAPTPAIVLELSTGARETLGQPVLIGRAPSVSQVSGLRLPRLVTVGGADQDISRNHAQFALEGDSVVVTDLHSRNGTIIRLPGREPQKLRAGEPTTIIVGTLVDFGSGVTLTVSEI